LLLAEGHLTRTPFGAILRRLVALPEPAGLADSIVADRSGGTAAEDGEVSEESPADAAIPRSRSQEGQTGLF